MKIYVKKVSQRLILGFIIVATLLVIYAIYPKYQFYVKDDAVYRLNKITGQITLKRSLSKFKTLPAGIENLLKPRYK